MTAIGNYREKVDHLLALRRQAETSVVREGLALTRVELQAANVEEAQRIVQAVAQSIQQRVHEGLARVVNRCLSAVFDDPYSFSIRFDRKRGKTEAACVFSRGGVDLDDPLNEVGGGVVDVAAMALRLGCLLLSRPARRRMLVLDEPFAKVRGRRNKARTREMLERLAADLGLQVLVTTDIPEFQMGTVVEMGDDAG